MSGGARSTQATLALMVLDGIVGAMIGGATYLLARLLVAGTGWGWLFGIALGLVLMGAGLFQRRGDRQGPERRLRGLAYATGILAGAALVALRVAEAGGAA